MKETNMLNKKRSCRSWRFLPLHIFMLCLNITFAHAQKQGQSLIDSLQAQLPKVKEDTGKVKLLYDLSVSYMSMNPGQGLNYAQQCLDLAIRLDWKKGIAAAHNGIGQNYHNKGDHTRELEHFEQALKIDESTRDKNDLARENLGIGNAYGSLCNFP
jgi:two-component system, NtrC family, sensor kinase